MESPDTWLEEASLSNERRAFQCCQEWYFEQAMYGIQIVRKGSRRRGYSQKRSRDPLFWWVLFLISSLPLPILCSRN